MESLWEQAWERPNFSAQDGDLNTDVLIIGGGMAGGLCGYCLSCSGVAFVGVGGGAKCRGITHKHTA